MEYSIKKPAHFDNEFFPVFMSIQQNRPVLVSMHLHEELEFLRILKGPVFIKSDNCEFKGNTGDIIFFQSNCAHFVQCTSSPDKVIQGLVFDKKILEDSIEDLYSNATYSAFNNADMFYFNTSHVLNNLLNSCMEQMYEEYVSKKPYFEISIKGTIYNMMAQILREYNSHIEIDTSAKEQAAKLIRLQPVLSYIKTYYKSTITLSDLSSQINMSPFYFSRFFKAAMDCTPIDYVIQYRIKMSIKLLSNFDNTIASVAEQVGFSTTNYFDKVFKDTYHISPFEYRKSITF